MAFGGLQKKGRNVPFFVVRRLEFLGNFPMPFNAWVETLPTIARKSKVSA